MNRILYWTDWLFRDITQRKGKYVIAEVPNWPLLLFMASIVFAVAINPGGFQKFLVIVAYVSLSYWGWLELHSGRSRFRKLLGILSLLAVVGALVLGLGL